MISEPLSCTSYYPALTPLHKTWDTQVISKSTACKCQQTYSGQLRGKQMDASMTQRVRTQWLTKGIKYPTLGPDWQPYSWGRTNKSVRYQSRGWGLVRLNYLDAWWCLSFCQHGSKVRNGDESTGGGRITRVWDVGARGKRAASPSRVPEFKC